MVENPLAIAGDKRDMGFIPGLGRSPGGVHGNPLKYSSFFLILESAMVILFIDFFLQNKTVNFNFYSYTICRIELK